MKKNMIFLRKEEDNQTQIEKKKLVFFSFQMKYEIKKQNSEEGHVL